MTWSGCRLVGSLQVLVCPRYINALYPETSREAAGHGARGRPPFVFNGTLARYRRDRTFRSVRLHVVPGLDLNRRQRFSAPAARQPALALKAYRTQVTLPPSLSGGEW